MTIYWILDTKKYSYVILLSPCRFKNLNRVLKLLKIFGNFFSLKQISLNERQTRMYCMTTDTRMLLTCIAFNKVKLKI